jgi:hypothetical protein
VGQGRGPAAGVFSKAQVMTRAVRTLDHVSRLHGRGQLDQRTAIWTTNDGHG